MLGRLVIAEIDLKKLASNIQQVRSLVGPHVKVMAVVKANAYGHGSIEIAKTALQNGAEYLGVVCLYEAKQLRDAGITSPILVLNYTDKESVEEAVTLHVRLTVIDKDVAEEIERVAKKNKKIVKVHVKIDTGMHRLGLSPEDALTFIEELQKYKHIELEGVFSHFATSDEEDLTFAYEQLRTFTDFLERLTKKGINPPLIHMANSAAILRIPESHFTMVRPGKILYGPLPDNEKISSLFPKPILSLKTKIVQIKTIDVGESVGYGRTFIAKRKTTIGLLPVGYADGFRRAPHNFGSVLVSGKRVNVIGRVSMDQTTIDITDVKGVKIGDEVVLIGKQKNEEITAQEIASRIGTINYEVVSSISARVSRVYA